MSVYVTRVTAKWSCLSQTDISVKIKRQYRPLQTWHICLILNRHVTTMHFLPQNKRGSSSKSYQSRCLQARSQHTERDSPFVSFELQPSGSTSSRCIAICPQVEAACSTLIRQWMEPVVNNTTVLFLSGFSASVFNSYWYWCPWYEPKTHLGIF